MARQSMNESGDVNIWKKKWKCMFLSIIMPNYMQKIRKMFISSNLTESHENARDYRNG